MLLTIIIFVLIAIIIWMFLAISGVVGPWKLQRKDTWKRKEHEKKVRNDFDKKQGL